VDRQPFVVQVLDSAGFASLVDAAAAVYGAAMARPSAVISSRRDLIRTHLDRAGFVATAALRSPTDSLAGFGYGYSGATGQWWHDVVARGLGAQVAAQWLPGAFELAELHVAPDSQGNGVGRSLIELLLANVTAPAVVLSTPDRLSPARALYDSLGFTDLLVDFRFPGSAEPYAVMGLRR